MYAIETAHRLITLLVVALGITFASIAGSQIIQLQERVRELENAALEYPEINISIPEDWLER